MSTLAAFEQRVEPRPPGLAAVAGAEIGRRSSRRPRSRRAGWCRSCRSVRAAPSRRNRGRRRSPLRHWRSGPGPPHRRRLRSAASCSRCRRSPGRSRSCRSRRSRPRRRARRASSSRPPAARPCRRPRSPTGLAKKSKMTVFALPPSRLAKSRKWVTDLRWPGSSRASSSTGGKSSRSTLGAAFSRWPSSPSSFGVIAIWCGPRRPSTWMSRMALLPSESKAWATMSEPTNSAGVLD